MRELLLKKILSSFSENSFRAFVKEFFETDGVPLVAHEDIGEDIFFRPIIDSYGGSIHSVFMLHFIPFELFKDPLNIKIVDPPLKNNLQKIERYYKGRKGQWGMVSPALTEDDALQTLAFLVNIANVSEDAYHEFIIPKYSQAAAACGIKADIYVGSYDSFFAKSPNCTENTIEKYFDNYREGISINLSHDEVYIDQYLSEKYIINGVLPHTLNPCEPVIVNRTVKLNQVFAEFTSLLKESTKEKDLECFLSAHYKEIFGYVYDRIETQLWLKFPEVDIANKNRRLDIFLRNCIENDWELFELKRITPLTTSYRDVPVFTREIMNALQQTKNYARILSQDSVKKKLAAQGIEYYEPSLRLVIGGRPNMSIQQWRWLKASNESNIKIITYDDLLKELKLRMENRA